MSSRRVLVGSAAALLMPASLLLTVPAVSAADDNTSLDAAASVRSASSTTKQKGQKIKLVAMPQIVQQGKRTSMSRSAQAAITATIKPKRPGRKVKLQKRKGSRWKTVLTQRQERSGRVEFGAKASRNGKALKYRVVATRFKGLKAAKSKPVTTDRWLTSMWTDEFKGKSLGSEWSLRGSAYEPGSKRNCSKASMDAVKVRRGALNLSVIKDRDRSGKCNTGASKKKFAYRANGHIGTQNRFAFTYGFAAARIKMHKSRGQHGGFWMQPNNPVGGSNSPKDTGAEIDVIEYFGDKHPQGGLTSFTYSKNRKGKDVKNGSWIKNSKQYLRNRRDGWSKNYHVFSVEWTPKQYIFRIDGRETWRTRVGVSGQAQYPILSMLASDYEIKKIGSDKKLPQTMKVDWVRFWQG